MKNTVISQRVNYLTFPVNCHSVGLMEMSLLGYGLGSLAFLASVQAHTGRDVVSHADVHFPKKGGRATVLVFLSAKCPCSASHEATLKTLYEEYGDAKIEFVGVHSNQDEEESLTKTHFQSAKLPFPVIQDQDAKLANEYKALKTPHVFVIQDEKIVFQGGVDDSADSTKAQKNYLAEALRELKAGKPVTVAKVRTLGCAIKR